MFGYIKTDTPNCYVKDTVLYKAAYCGLCKSIGKVCGQKGRFALNYDLTFLSILAHNLIGEDIKIKQERCVTHFIKKRPVAAADPLSQRIAALDVILAYHKCNDDVLDNGKGKFKRAFFSRGYKRAVKKEPELDRIVSENYKKLLELEKANCDSIDRAADPFGNMMKGVFGELLGDKSDENTEKLAYSIGKWIYLIDAIDDFDKDLKSGDYNVFVLSDKAAKSKAEFLEKNGECVENIFGEILYEVAESAKSLRYNFNHDLTDNVLLRGLRLETKRITEKRK